MSLKLKRLQARNEETSNAQIPVRLVRNGEKDKRSENVNRPQRYKQWVIKSENSVRFLIEDAEQGKVVSYPKSTFQKEAGSHGAFREGDLLFLPKHSKR